MTLPVRFHPDARDEFIAEVDWYDDRAGLGERFAEAVEIAIEFAAEDPEAWPPLRGWPREPIVRSKGVTSFPYRVLYLVRDDVLTVVAVAHTKRRPGYWKDRARA
ncbi:type II toxin-antitoxin system RelE/ParE family toxin [Janibacter limosus]|jgi:plasmid stabilization system protein ParE|uniref:Type II toxin-antitoxin system RelE/ParE family toxin n=1 Tax=Janibacter limosus TaxID=53458 RepID=A0A4P6MVT3_9MICO|nr:type II toxin-antitoxin system RelE/ParE family toxin [Janibacter limosus]QBF47042.1 type II toxin-antitoxin system RelE/ParE family toxin [Janibacter limosus]